MKIIRSLKNVSGDLTVKDGDVVITDKDSGIILKNQAEDEKRVTVITEESIDALQIKDA